MIAQCGFVGIDEAPDRKAVAQLPEEGLEALLLGLDDTADADRPGDLAGISEGAVRGAPVA